MRITLAITVLVGLMIVGGCSAPTHKLSLSKWRSELERYIVDKADGDPGVLADLRDAEGRNAFVLLGHPEPEAATDYYGLLVDIQPVGPRTGYIFLVGGVRKTQLDTITPVLMLAEPAKLQWKTGQPSADAFKRYRDYVVQQWRKHHDDDGTEPFYCGFPMPGDHFTVSMSGQTATIRHEASGAAWSVGLQ